MTRPLSGGRSMSGSGVSLGMTADAFIATSADLAWRADEAVSGAVTTSLVPYMGSTALPKNGSGQAVKAASANFSGAPLSITFVAGAGSYSAALATPAAYSFATVFRTTHTSVASHAMTVGGTINTGTSAGVSGTTNGFAQKLVASASKAISAVPVLIVQLSLFDASGVTVYANSYTPVTTASAGALAGNTLHIGALDSANTFTARGEWVTSGFWGRKLGTDEAATVLSMLGAKYVVTIAA